MRVIIWSALNIFKSAHIDGFLIFVLDRPEIKYFGSDQKNDMAAVGKSVKITCKADASPPPEYKIFHNSTELTDVINGVKTIVSVNYDDSGKYKCIAKNCRGNMFEIFNFTVKDEICVKTCLLGFHLM